jgi:hypothetical protein
MPMSALRSAFAHHVFLVGGRVYTVPVLQPWKDHPLRQPSHHVLEQGVWGVAWGAAVGSCAVYCEDASQGVGRWFCEGFRLGEWLRLCEVFGFCEGFGLCEWLRLCEVFGFCEGHDVGARARFGRCTFFGYGRHWALPLRPVPNGCLIWRIAFGLLVGRCLGDGIGPVKVLGS